MLGTLNTQHNLPRADKYSTLTNSMGTARETLNLALTAIIIPLENI